MESFSSEIGKKMRSAVKAKLIELGTEGSTGYVDEELPDYVMIMVANKRSKQQMTTDLTLFLGTKTELFVTWLHEVLQKLQEVTVPAPTSKKRKSSNQKDETTISKKDKKAAKKDKKAGKKSEQTPTEKSTVSSENNATTTTTTVPILPTGSIRDVFAEDLLERAKHNLIANADAAAHIKKAKGATSSREAGATNEFDIPTISEISSSTTANNSKIVISGDRAKDLADLAAIQKKIYAAKKHLKELGELKDNESEDEDLLKLRDEGSSDGLSVDNADISRQTSHTEPQSTKAKSPIVFDKDKPGTPESTPPPQRNNKTHTPPPLPSAAIRTTRNSSKDRRQNQQHGPQEPPQPTRSRERERREHSPPSQQQQQKRPVHERLGAKLQSAERRAPTRREKELYVPAHRRQDSRSDLERDNRERWRSRERDDRRTEPNEKRNERDDRRGGNGERQDTRRSEREFKKQRDISANSDDEESASPKQQQQHDNARHRVISKVIVAPAKQIESSEDEIDKNVNSVIKIKPRPPVSPSRQACKNLLLRAVAEAQRSTILTKPKATKDDEGKKPAQSGKVKSRLGRTITNTDNDELFTKDLRERRLKRGANSSILFRRQAENFIIEVEGNLNSKRRRRGDSEESLHSNEDEEYKDEAVSDATLSVQYKAHGLAEDEELYDEDELAADIYHSADEQNEEDGMDLPKTQFVVTLNEERAAEKLRRLKRVQQSHSMSQSRSPQPQVSSSSTLARHNSNEPTSTTTQQFDRSRSRETRRSDIRSRLAKNKLRPATPLSPTRAARLRERESMNSSPASTHTPPPQSHRQKRDRGSNGSGNSGYVDSYQQRKSAKDIKKIIIKNDTDDDVESESSPQKQNADNEQRKQREARRISKDEHESSKRSKTPPPLPTSPSMQSQPQTNKTTPKSSSSDRERDRANHNESNNSSSPAKSRHKPIKFDLIRAESQRSSRSKSREHSLERVIRDNIEERRKISIRGGEVNNKYDNIPSLSSVALDSAVMRVMKPKERCKYHPNCTKQFCDFYHPTAPCKAFPNCKFADKCMYSHPNCKYDMACTNLDCNFSHSGVRNPNQLQPTAPPLSSHVVPVQNYKTISSAPAGGSTAMCKYYPNCTKVGCTFYHPKPCKFGKNCLNKLECNFYHHELQSKFKWVASAT